MAIYHFSAKVISRANGSSALAAAAYRSASRLEDERLGRAHDFSNKAGVVHSEVMLPDGAPEEWADREKLWNAVEASELRKDAQLSREIEFALPRELGQAENTRLARDFVEREFVARGMIADLNVHWDVDADGEAKPHAHVMLTTREVGPDGFGAKVRDWNRTDLLQHWREAWADHVNERLASLDVDARIDHRTLEAQGIDLEPQHKIGPAASRMGGQGLESERLVEHHAIARANGEKLLANPALALDAITHQQATFTKRDLARFVHRHSKGMEQFERVMAAVKSVPELVALGVDGRGDERFTSRAMIETEQRLERATVRLEAHRRHALLGSHRDLAIARAADRGLVLSAEQQSALEHVTEAKGLGVVIGYAGTGKSAMLGVAREAWASAGYNVRGAALSGIAAENLEGGSGIASRTIASMEHQWAQGRDVLANRDVLVIDEAGMIGTRQLERVMTEAEKRGAKVVLVGDPEQLQAIEAGAAFRATAERHGGVEVTQIRRQREDWQREATRELATGRTGEAIADYDARGHIHPADTREEARGALVDRWDRDRVASPDVSRIILTHTNDEVRALNLDARGRLRVAGSLGGDVTLQTDRGKRQFAVGDRVMFLKNDRSLGVKNGTLGKIETVSQARMAVMLDDGRSVSFDVKDYNQIDHGYAATVHKAQGVTVDRVHVLATPGLDRHAAYVALSRHRDAVDLHYGRDDFADRSRLIAKLSRERGKDMVSDYSRDFADRRQIRLPERVIAPAKPAPAHDPFADFGRALAGRPRSPSNDMFAGLNIPVAARPTPALDRANGLGAAVQRYARAFAEVTRLNEAGRQALPHQIEALRKAERALDQVRSDASRDASKTFEQDPRLVDEAAKGRTTAVIRAMALEAELRTNPQLRADRFMGDWKKLMQERDTLRFDGHEARAQKIEGRLEAMGKQLQRDPQLESLLKPRARELGIDAISDRSLSQSIQRWFARSRGREIDM